MLHDECRDAAAAGTMMLRQSDALDYLRDDQLVALAVCLLPPTFNSSSSSLDYMQTRLKTTVLSNQAPAYARIIALSCLIGVRLLELSRPMQLPYSAVTLVQLYANYSMGKDSACAAAAPSLAVALLDLAARTQVRHCFCSITCHSRLLLPAVSGSQVAYCIASRSRRRHLPPRPSHQGVGRGDCAWAGRGYA
jgi:hypothetical protein